MGASGADPSGGSRAAVAAASGHSQSGHSQSGHSEWFALLAGQTALVEGDGLEVTGTVKQAAVGATLIECDESCWADGDAHKVNVSVFASDALYRLSGSATAASTTVRMDSSVTIERIQRRRWPRRRLDLKATLCSDAGAQMEGVPGRTVDLSVGGVCVETLRPWYGGDDASLILRLPDGTSLVSAAETVAVEELDDGWRYRLAFRDLADEDADRLARITDAGQTA
jgi:hypothetical protein